MLNAGQYLVLIDFQETHQPALDRAIKLAKQHGSGVTALLVVYDWAAELDTMVAGTILNNMRKPYLVAAKEWLDGLLKGYSDTDVTIEPHVEWNKRAYKSVLEYSRVNDYQLVLKSSRHHPLSSRVLKKPDDWHLVRESSVPVLFVKEDHNDQQSDPQTILVAVDMPEADSESDELSQNLIKIALELQSETGSSVELVNAYPVLNGVASLLPEVVDYHVFEAELRDSHSQSLRKFAEDCGIDPAKAHVHEGPVGMAVAAVAKECNADLVVCGSNNRKGVTGAIIGNSAESILEQTECDLLVLMH